MERSGDYQRRIVEALSLLMKEHDLLPYDLYAYAKALDDTFTSEAATIYDALKAMLLEDMDFDGWRVGDQHLDHYIYDDDGSLRVIKTYVAPLWGDHYWRDAFRKELKKIVYANTKGSLAFSQLVRIAAVRATRKRADADRQPGGRDH